MACRPEADECEGVVEKEEAEAPRVWARARVVAIAAETEVAGPEALEGAGEAAAGDWAGEAEEEPGMGSVVERMRVGERWARATEGKSGPASGVAVAVEERVDWEE